MLIGFLAGQLAAAGGVDDRNHPAPLRADVAADRTAAGLGLADVELAVALRSLDRQVEVVDDRFLVVHRGRRPRRPGASSASEDAAATGQQRDARDQCDCRLEDHRQNGSREEALAWLGVRPFPGPDPVIEGRKCVVPEAGLEPARLSTASFKPATSTNSVTRARRADHRARARPSRARSAPAQGSGQRSGSKPTVTRAGRPLDDRPLDHAGTGRASARGPSQRRRRRRAAPSSS